jgi:hypothetical protein
MSKEQVRDRIIANTLAAYSISKADLLGMCRDSDLVVARKSVARSLKAAGFGVCHIGRILNRDRSTIEHYLGFRHPARASLPNSVSCFPDDVRRAICDAADNECTTPAAIVTQWVTDRARMEISQQRSAA